MSLFQAVIATATKHLPTTEAHTHVAGIVLVLQTDRARVSERSVAYARGTWHPVAVIATDALSPTDFLVPSTFPVELLTLYAAVARAAAPPAPLYCTDLA
jgi:hypothetical protein